MHSSHTQFWKPDKLTRARINRGDKIVREYYEKKDKEAAERLRMALSAKQINEFDS